MTTGSTIARTGPGLLIALTLLVAGCGGDSYDNVTLTGEVTIDGAKVPKGSLTFSPLDDGGPVVGAEIVDGQYTCQGVPLGRHRVAIIAQAAEMQTIQDMATGGTHEVPIDILPPKYQSGIEITVSGESARQDFMLHSGP